VARSTHKYKQRRDTVTGRDRQTDRQTFKYINVCMFTTSLIAIHKKFNKHGYMYLYVWLRWVKDTHTHPQRQTDRQKP